MQLQMFFGMSLCLPLAYWQQWQKQKAASDNAAEPLLSATSEEVCLQVARQLQCNKEVVLSIGRLLAT